MEIANKRIAEVKKRLQQAKDDNEWVIVEDIDYGIINSVRVKIIYIGDRWAVGEKIVYNGDEAYHVKHTINYTSVIGAGGERVNLIFGGDNSFV